MIPLNRLVCVTQKLAALYELDICQPDVSSGCTILPANARIFPNIPSCYLVLLTRPFLLKPIRFNTLALKSNVIKLMLPNFTILSTNRKLIFRGPYYYCYLSVFVHLVLSCKANARLYLAKTGHGPHSS